MENQTADAYRRVPERKRNGWRRLAGAALCAVLLCASAAGALAEPLTPEKLGEKLEESRVQGIQPPGVTLNLFDYVASKDGKTEKDLLGVNGGAKESDWNKGINQHGMLLFGDGMIGAGYWNIGAGANRLWARNNTNMQGIVKPILKDGYPCVDTQRAGMTLEQTSDNKSELGLPNVEHANDENSANDAKNAKGLSGALTGREPSLKYLFDPHVDLGENVKRSYSGVTGLFRVDNEGYYYYDARQNFAEYDEDSNAFVLYNAPAVWRSDGAWNPETGKFDGSKSIGNFYPFNKGEQVFDSVDSGGRLTSSADIYNAKWSSAADGFQNKATNEYFFINHHMGMSMTVDFAQPENGTIKMGTEEKDMTFQFSGDDDVWVFVDGVLVLDLGGIHSELYGTINFATGEVRTGQGWRYASGMPEEDTIEEENSYRKTTLYQLFVEALKPDDLKVTNGWTTRDGNKIFSTGTEHELKLFYLERGNYDSSLHMKFNLQPPLYHSIRKVNQDGKPLKGVSFELYPAQKKDSKPLNPTVGTELADDFEIAGDLIGTLTTDEDGMATFVRKDGSPFSFSDWAHREGDTLFILKEKKPPEGYRRLPHDLVLSFNATTSMLTVLNRYQTGAYSSFISYIKEMAGVTYGAFDEKTGDINPSDTPLEKSHEKDGLVIAVPMLLQKNLSGGGTGQDDGTWVALYGSNETSYQAVIPAERSAEAWRKAVLKAALYQASNEHWPKWRLTYNEEGHLEGALTDLPGRADRYALINKDSADMKMVYGIIEPSALAKLRITGNSSKERYDALEAYVSEKLKAGAAAGKTPDTVMEEICADIEFGGSNFADRGFSFLNTDQFQRDFRSMIYIPNERRELRLWKVDEDGRGVNGATFTLYTEDGLEAASGVTAAVDGRDGVLVFTPEALTHADGRVQDGYARVEWAEEGRYYIQETSAPAGYTLNPTRIPVVVGHYSVYADAGSKTDGVSVFAGVGKLMQTMARYAAHNAVNITLRDIIAFAQTQPSNAFDLNGWEDAKLENTQISRSMNLHYGCNAVIDYGLHDEDGGENIYPFFTADEGFLRTRVEQNTDALQNQRYAVDDNATNFDDLKGEDLTSLFSQINIVVVTDAKEVKTETGRLSIRKTVEGDKIEDADYTRNFTFTVTLQDRNGKPLTDTYYYYGEQRAGYIRDGGTLSLRHDEALTILGLPEGAKWTVAEMPAGADWKVMPESGVISGGIETDETAYATFVNHKGLPLGDLSVTKQVAGDGGDPQKDFSFTVTLDDPTISGEFGGMTFVNGVASFTLRHGESKTASGLPAGIGYAVTEVKEEGYTAACDKADGTISAGTETKAVFVNTYATPTPRPTDDVPKTDVTVTKIWRDEGYDGRPDSFTVFFSKDGVHFHTRTIRRDEPSTSVSADGNTWTFVAQWNAGDYDVEELDVPGYVSSVVKEGNHFTITNTYMPKTGDSRSILRDILLAGCGLALLAAAWRLLKKPHRRR